MKNTDTMQEDMTSLMLSCEGLGLIKPALQAHPRAHDACSSPPPPSPSPPSPLGALKSFVDHVESPTSRCARHLTQPQAVSFGLALSSQLDLHTRAPICWSHLASIARALRRRPTSRPAKTRPRRRTPLRRRHPRRRRRPRARCRWRSAWQRCKRTISPSRPRGPLAAVRCLVSIPRRVGYSPALPARCASLLLISWSSRDQGRRSQGAVRSRRRSHSRRSAATSEAGSARWGHARASIVSAAALDGRGTPAVAAPGGRGTPAASPRQP